MARLVFGMNQSLDGCVDHTAFAPGPTRFRHFVAEAAGQAGSVYGRTMFEIMQYWDDERPEWTADVRSGLTTRRIHRMHRIVSCFVVLAAAVAAPARAQSVNPDALAWPVGTFSIIAYDAATGDIGGAVQSRVFSVGNGVLWAEAGVGIAATQAIVDVSYGPQALALLRQGVSAAEVVQRVLAADPDPEPVRWTKDGRQFAVLDAQGNVATHTGPRASAWAGGRTCAAPHRCAAQGNILAGAAVVDSMIAAFERTPGRLHLRLVAALEAGQRAGGDTRGQQSAALVIVNVKKGCGIWLNNDVILRLQVDDSPEPIRELRRLAETPEAQRRNARCRVSP